MYSGLFTPPQKREDIKDNEECRKLRVLRMIAPTYSEIFKRDIFGSELMDSDNSEKSNDQRSPLSIHVTEQR